MHKKLSAVAALAALTISAFASGAMPAFADERPWQVPGPSVSESGPAGWVDDCAGRGGGTDCPTEVNRYPNRYGNGGHYRDDWQYREGRHQHRGNHRFERRHWEPRYQRHWERPQFGIRIVPEYRPRYRQAPEIGLSRAHVNWCENRYRSYRAWDNTFQPYSGPRQQCWSPYS